MFAGLRQKMKIHPPATVAWSKVIGTFEALPEIYQTFFRQIQKDTDGELPYLVLTPASEKMIRRTPEQLACIARDNFYILENVENELRITAFPLSQIYSLEVGAILLYSWIKVQGLTSHGQLQSKTIEFNSISYPHFNPLLKQIRRVPVVGIKKAREAEKFNCLASSSYKFMNYGRKSLLGDEKVMKILWEPEIRDRFFSKLDIPITRLKSYSHLFILTDKEIILIREDDLTHSIKGAHYGGIWQFIARANLASLKIHESDGNRFFLQINLRGDQTIHLLFRNENRIGVEEMINMLHAVPMAAEPVPV